MNLALSGAGLNGRVQKLENLWPNIEEETLFEYAKTDEVSSHLGYLLTKSSLDYADFWQTEIDRIENYITVLMNTLEAVATELKKESINIVALKNAGIAKAIFKNNACSPMGDIDLLVGSKDFIRAHELIIDMGFTFKFRSELENEDLEEAFRSGGTEYYKMVSGYKIWLELQWRPIAGRWIQPHNEPNGDQLMENSIDVEGSNIKILAPEDNLLQVALHTAKHSYCRAPGFRLHSDVDRIVRFQKIDWDSFCKKVTELKLTNAVYFSLYFAKQLVGTPIPDSVLKRLKPAYYRRKLIFYYLNKAGIYNQKKKKFTKIGYIIFNLALFDSIGENIKALFPPFDSLKIKYPIKSKWAMPYYYTIRLKDLLFRRAQL